MTVDSVQGAVRGTVTLASQSGVAMFTPNAGHTGPASFTYTIKDLSNAHSTATVSLTVGASGNQPPNAVADTATTDEDSTVTINVLANDSDADIPPNPLTVTRSQSHWDAGHRDHQRSTTPSPTTPVGRSSRSTLESS